MGGALQSSLSSTFEINEAGIEEENSIFVPSLTFSPNHGKNLLLSKNNLVARRIPGSFCNGIVFSEQPVNAFGVTIKLNKVANQWSGYLRVGFTSKDPSRLNPKSLPKSLVPDLCSKKGYWAKSLDYENLSSGDVIHVWVDSRGLAKYTVNSHLPGREACRVFLEKLPIAEYLWAVFDVYGNCTEIEIMPNSGPRNVHEMTIRQSYSGCCLTPLSNQIAFCNNNSNPTTNQFTHTSTAAAIFANNLLIQLGSNPILPNDLFDIFFHPVCGSKVQISDCATVALRDPDTYHNGLLFVNSPLLCNRTYLFTIVEKSERCLGNLRIGVTDVNPSVLAKNPDPWPADSMDFSSAREGEFWHVCQIFQACNVGDVIAVFVTKLSKSSNQRVVMFNIIHPKAAASSTLPESEMYNGWLKLCDVTPVTGQLWLLIDLFGKTNSVALIGMTSQFRPEDQHSDLKCSTSSNQQTSLTVVDLSHSQSCNSTPELNPKRPDVDNDNDSLNAECAVCMQYNSDTVIYDCGHCCLCYNCAHDLLRLKHHCPICRRPIKDVIKVFYG